MNSEERFRQSLEELINSKAFPFDEANWDKARGMIDAAKKPRRIAPFILGGILLLGTIISGIYFLSDTSTAATEKSALAATKEIQAVVEPAELTSLPQTRLSNPAAPSPKSSSANPSGTKPLTSHSAPKNRTSRETAPVKEMKEAPVALVKQAQADANVLPLPPTQIKNDPALSETKEPVVPAPVKDQEADVPVNAAPVKAETPTDKRNDVVAETEKNAAPATNDSKGSTETTTPAATDPLVNEPGNTASPVNTSIAHSEPLTKTADNVFAPAESTIANPENKEPAQQPVTLNDSLTSAKVEELPADNDQGELGRPKAYPVFVSVEAGANYMYGWQNPGVRDASGFNPVIGVNYFNNFKPKMSLTFGIQYTSINKLHYSTYTSKVSHFAFGEESNVTVFTPVKVHYLVVPLRFNYNLNVMNSVGIGCNLSYLLNVESEVETYTEKLNRKYNQTLSKSKGYTEGFKIYDTQVSAFYKRRLYPNLALNLELFYGLTDIKDNTFFSSNVFERNTGLKLTLVYNFLKK